MSRYRALTRSVTENRRYYGPVDAGFVIPPATSGAAGAVLLTDGQKQALLVLRGSETALAVVAELQKRGEFAVTGGDYMALCNLGFAVNKGTRNVLARHARWKADQVAG